MLMPPNVIAITGLAFDARIAAGRGVNALRATERLRLPDWLEGSTACEYSGIISFGIARGLDRRLSPGDWIVAWSVVTDMRHSRPIRVGRGSSSITTRRPTIRRGLKPWPKSGAGRATKVGAITTSRRSSCPSTSTRKRPLAKSGVLLNKPYGIGGRRKADVP
jgi:hypothetical protein